MMKKINIYALFGDFGLHAERITECPTHNVYFSRNRFEDYVSFDGLSKGRLIIDREILDQVIGDIDNELFHAVYCGDSAEALLLYYVLKRKGIHRKIFLINEVDMFKRARDINDLILRYYNEDTFKDFITSPDNNWMYIIHSRKGEYLDMGIPEENLYYVPIARPSIGFFFPGLVNLIETGTRSNVPSPVEGSVLATGSHDRDYPTLFEAVEGLDIEVHVICNLDVYKPIPAPNIFWHDSMPEVDYVSALSRSRYVIIPLKESGRSAGQMNCAIAMYFGKMVVSTRCDSLKDHIIDGKSGFFYRAGDVGDLRRVLNNIESMHDDEIEEMGGEAKKLEERLSKLAEKELSRFLSVI